ncbi:MAG: aldo/keto reductase [Candidatus Colwellbacteria bacterium CG10_big_fil_rev_8_21_14_0_10_42_22]|uniref:Aldo/keto reductase n=1 Tax=Candidatus Colwellbacteria bacterium CG10_big_fil_rev_8_21_14_0_10_42_22 TaxID=1974540 RepID=A0A2H0VFP9_9BACT|nr:MAG: aldo/keto reductase [Candidatus Colwellbacteria bacterium CG10_big_fil_rev_8_21_14_0_10_42_22]
MNIWKLDNGFELPKVGLGTWLMGGNMEANSSDDEVCLRAIQSALDLGYRHIDTAELYGNGHAEELVGQAITNTKRENLIIATKVAKTNLQYEDVLKAAKGSLKRLKLDYVDIYYIHAPNPNIPVEGTMKAMNKLIKEGLIKNIAVSNFTIDMIREAQSFADTKIVANQVEYSLSTQLEDNYGYSKNVCSEMVPYCQENGIMLVAYRPVNRGELLEPNKILDKVAQKYGKTRAQIAINWLVSQKNVVTIPMSQNETHLKENLEAGDWEMDPEDIEALGVAYR